MQFADADDTLVYGSSNWSSMGLQFVFPDDCYAVTLTR